MALTLAANINATQRNIRVTGTVPSDLEQGRQFRIGDELVEFFAFDRSTVPLIVAYMAGNRTNWRVTRGVGESVAASHLSGVALLGAQDAYTSGDDQDAPGPFPAGGATPGLDAVLNAGSDGGGLSVSNLGDVQSASVTPTAIQDPAFSQGSLGQAPVADGAGSWAWGAKAGVAISDEDPGFVGAGNVWLRTPTSVPADIAGTGPFAQAYIRKADDSGWIQVTSAVIDEDGNLRGAALTDIDSGDTYEIRTWDADGGMRNDISIYDAALEIIHSNAAGFARSKVQIGNAGGGSEAAVVMSSLDTDGTTELASATVSPSEVRLNFAGAHQYVADETGIAITTSGTFTYNGDEVAVVP